MKGNVIGVAGHVPEDERTIADMKRGEVGYTVPWAYSKKENMLNTSHTLSEKGGTAHLRVECVGEDSYSLTFETPRYRDFLGRE
jgi:hypothetical protein